VNTICILQLKKNTNEKLQGGAEGSKNHQIKSVTQWILKRANNLFSRYEAFAHRRV